jgi:hypothetical protein
MTNREIAKYIKLLNQGKGKETIFLRKLNDNVELAKVWEGIPKQYEKINHNSGPYTFFFIKDELNKYVGAVVDMFHDLHWYITPFYRRKGHLTNALRTAILPYLFKYIDEQKISINKRDIGRTNYKNSKRVAELLGFKLIDSEYGVDSFILSESDFNWEFNTLSEKNYIIDKDRLLLLSKKANYVSNILWMIQNELEMAYNDSLELDEYVSEIRKYVWKIEDLQFNKNFKF